MKVERFATGILSTNCYLAICEETKKTVVIDPAACPSYLMEHMKTEGLQVEAILLTHGHFDHTMGIEGFLREYPVPVYACEAEKEILSTPRKNLSLTYTKGYSFEGATFLRDGQELELAGCIFRMIHTPGHTPGGCCYYVESEQILFSGDTLFQNSIGRADFPESDPQALLDAIREKLFVLPDEVLVYPGHMGETTIGHEKRNNPYCKLRDAHDIDHL